LKIPFYIIILLFALASCQASADKRANQIDSLPLAHIPHLPDREIYHEAVKEYVNANLVNNNFSGGILVAKNGVIVYEEYAGYKDFRSKDSLTAETPVHIASTTKTITAMAVLKLVEQGKLELDDTLNSFFPQLAYEGITIKMLLSHRTGLPNYLYYFEKNKWDKKKMITNQDVLESLYKKQPGGSGRPGRNFNYNNTNYVLLATLIEKVSGLTYADFLKNEIFDPLKMKHTYVYDMHTAALATPSFNWDGSFWALDEFDLTYGDKNIYSTPRDLLKWDQALSSGRVLNATLLDSAYTPLSNERPSIHNYGLGWRLLLLKNGKKVIYHHGRWHGFNSIFARLPEENATIIILGNRFNRRIYEARDMYDIFGDYSGKGPWIKSNHNQTKNSSLSKKA
jgi:CubicO group peptidase (beta-lactamase class C family)